MKRHATAAVAALLLPVIPAAQAQTAAPAPAQQASAATAIEIVGRRDGGTYQAGEVSGSKTSLPLQELPQSVRVISRQAIDDLGAVRLDDVLDYVGGVSRQNSFGGLWDNIAIRGLPGNENTGMAMLLNGLAGNRGFNAPRDLSNVERIEFLKGPAASLYGASEPGGTLNIVTKKPLFGRAANALEFYGGSFGSYRAALDSTGPVNDVLAYRLNVAVERRDSFRDQVKIARDVVSPAITWQLSPTTTLDYFGEFLRHKAPLDRGVVAVRNQLGAVPRERFLGEPGDGDVTLHNETHQLVLAHDWSADWHSRVALSYRESGLVGFSTEATRLDPVDVGPALWRQRRFRDYNSDDAQLQVELAGKTQLAGMAHDLLIGVEAFHYKQSQLVLRVNPSAAAPYRIDIFNPVYGQPRPTPPLNVDTVEHQRNTALTLQDAVTLAPQWRLLAGVRVDRYVQSLDNHRTNTTAAQKPGEASPRLGLTWLPTPQWSVYANAGKSFRPNTGASATNQPFDAESGRAVELGGKWERADQRFAANVALFDIVKRNVLTTDPNNTAFSISTGEITSRGIEGDVSGQLTAQWRLTGSFSVNDVKVTRDNLLQVDGRLLNVPKVNASVLAVYEGTLGNGSRFGVGGGVTHMGKRLGQARTQAEANAGTPAFELPDYTTAKLVAYWRVTPAVRVSLDVDNVFDKTYYTSSYSRVWVAPGTPRNFTLGAQLRF